MTSVDVNAALRSAASRRMVIKPPQGLVPINVAEIWRYRDLLWFMTQRDVIVRYKQSLFGVLWAVIPPLVQMVIFGTLFTLLMERTPTVPGVPYAISAFCALVPWHLFANSMNKAGVSVVGNRNLITKVYFPRLIAPVAPILAALFDFMIAFVVLIGIIAAFALGTDYQFQFTWALAVLPALVLLAMVTAFAVSLWLAALNSIYRDIRHVSRFIVQIWMIATPVVYVVKVEPALIRLGHDHQIPWLVDWAPILAWLYEVNPMAVVSKGFHWAILGSAAPAVNVVVASCSLVLLLMLGGLFFFRRMERYFVDLV